MKDTIYTIRKSAYRFLSGTLLSRVTGMLRDMAMAYAFGTQPSVAAFMIAFRFAHLLRRLLGEGALQSAFIPEFEALRNQDSTRALAFFRDLSFNLSSFLILIITVSMGLLIAAFKWIDLNPSNQETIFLTILMLPSLLFICLFGINASFLQCEKKYFIPSIAPIFFNLVWIISIFLLIHLSASEAMPWLACAVIFGCFFQWLTTLPSVWKSVKSFSFFSLRQVEFFSFDVRRLMKPLFLGIIGVAASQINNAIDSLYARFAEPEGPALLWYAIRIQQLPLALFGISIAGAILPPLSRALKAERMEDYQNFLEDAFLRTLNFIVPVTVALFLMGDISVKLIYGHGDFGSSSVVNTTYCLWAYGLGLIPSAFVLILAPASYAQHSYRLPALASFLAMLLNIFLNSLFIMYLGWGAISVAIATSLSAWMNFLLLYKDLSRKNNLLNVFSFLSKGINISLATLISAWMTYQMRITIQQLPILSDFLLFSISNLELLKFFIFQILTFFGIFIAFFYLFDQYLTPYYLYRYLKNNRY